MEYVLIAILVNFRYEYSTSAISQEFKNKQTCEAAGDVLIHKHTNLWKDKRLTENTYYICVPK